MSEESKHANVGHGDYERRDIGIAGVLYFLAGLAVLGVMVHFIVAGLYSYLDKRSQAAQAPVSPMIHNAPADTRKLPTDYKDYLKQNFPSPQLEVDERTQLNDIRIAEEQTLNSYGYVDKSAGTVRIPIERAMDLIVQRGLPVRTAGNPAEPATKDASKIAGVDMKGMKQ